MDIGEIIRIRRTLLGMSQAQLSERLGISRNQVSNLETGKSNPSAKVLRALEDALETSFEELLANPNAEPLVWLTRAKPVSSAEDVEVAYLEAGPGQRLTPLRVRIAPGSQWENHDYSNSGGENFVYVLSGDVEWKSEERWHQLERRHALYVVGAGPVVWRNTALEWAELLWIGGQ